MKDEKQPPHEAEGSPHPPRESLNADSIEAPVDIHNRRVARGTELPFHARSTGKYREGRGFAYYREGFDAYCVFITVSGAGEIVYRGETKRMERGDMVFTSSGLPAHVRSLNDDWRFCFVNIGGNACPYFEELWNGGGCTVIRPRDAGHYADLMDCISAELGAPDASSDLTVNLLITTLLTDALKEKSENETPYSPRQYPPWVREASAILSEKCAEELRISELATHFYMEQNNFIRRFKGYTGKTPKEYQIACRMERATALLSGSDLSLSEIAARCGFASHSFFSKTFKRLYGITPTQYRLGLPNS